MVALTACGGSGLDAHAKAACAHVRHIDAGGDTGLLDTVGEEFAATGDAAKSSNKDLRAAATMTSPASSLPPDSELYENPADVRFNAVAAWCRLHG